MFSKVSLSLSLALVLLTALLAGTTPVQAAAVVRYAAPIAQGSGNCSSWANACPLQTALNGAASDNEIWVQAGVYKPTDNSSDRNATFTLRSGVGVYGGFAGMETARDQRDWHISVTILSGDIDQNDTDTDGNFIAETTANIQGANSYHVVSSSNLDASAVLDGFVITAGQANTWGGGNGGGMINNSANPTLTNIIFSGNSATSGGGVYNNSSSPTLTNVTFNGNSVDYFGGGIYNYISDPSLTDINFNANFATRLGGGMCNEGSNPTLASVTFNANSATNSGGGLYNGSSSPTLTNVTFSANIVTDSEMGTGGGMANSSSSPKLANVTFSANSASYGGGVYNNDSSSSPLLTNVTFSANSAHYGGGMYNNSSSPTLTNVTFSGNSATNKGGGMYNYAGGLMLANVTFNDNTANYGGGIYNYFSDPSLTNVILWGDSAPNNAEIYNESSAPAIAFSDIQGGYPGIGNINADPLFVDAASGNLRLQSTSPVIDAGDDGALPFEVTTDLDGNPRFSDLGVDMGAYEYQGAPAFRLLVSIEGNGFGSVTSATAGINCPDDCTQVYAENTEVILTAAAGTFTSFDGWQVCDNPSGNTCTLTMNANRQATATFIRSGPGVFYTAPSAQSSGDCSSWANACLLQTALSVAISGDEIWVQEGLHNPTDNLSDLAATFTLRDGVAIYGGFAGTEIARDQRDWQANLTILSGDIDKNDTNTDGNFIAETTADIQGTNSYHVVSSSSLGTSAILDGFIITAGRSDTSGGGGMYNDSSNPALANLTFSGNSANNGMGGGMYNDFSNLTLTDVAFSGNSAGSGGGMYNFSSSPALTNVTFSGNSANNGTGGGGIYNNSSSPTLTNVTFSENSALYGGGMYNFSSNPLLTNITFSSNTATSGGGMFNEGSSSPTLVNITFDDNSATNSGGGVYNSSSGPTLANVTFNANSANNGGGMYSYNFSNPSLTDVTFSGNSAGYGGGMYNGYSSNPLLTDVTFRANSAGWGGGVYNNSSSPTMVNITFDDNSATNSGGGIFNDSSSSTLTNVTFSGNSATNKGGGMYNYSGALMLANVTFNGNTANYGGGIYNYLSAPSLTNVVLWGDSAPNNAEIYNESSAPAIAFSDIQGGYPGTGNINADPLFVDAASDNLRLQSTSPAIDAGDAAALPFNVTTDLDGNPRFSDLGVDMGAYEYQGAPAIRLLVSIDGDGFGSVTSAPAGINCPGDCAQVYAENTPVTLTATDGEHSSFDGWQGCDNPSGSTCALVMSIQQQVTATFIRSGSGVFYAAPNAQGSGNCSSWANACPLQTALSVTTSGDEIWAQEGVHNPTDNSSDLTATFTLQDGVSVYGGFTGTESNRSQRDWQTNLTILSGDIDQNDSNTDGNFIAETTADIQGTNSYHVVSSSNLDASAVLDGFIITAGRGAASGGGMYNDSSSPTLANLTFSGNSANSGGGMFNNYGNPTLANITLNGNLASYGGGMYNNSTSPSPTLINVTFSNNSALDYGGGMLNSSSNPALTNVTFNNNSAADSGGGMFNVSSSPVLTNVTFDNNSAASYGGGIYNGSSNPTLTEVTFNSNSAYNGGGMCNYSSSPKLTHSAFNDNSATDKGGGIYNSNYSSPSLANVTFNINDANYGGGIYNNLSSPSLVNITFNANSATFRGGGVYNELSSSPTLENVILWGDSAPNGAEIYNNDSTATVTYSNIQGGYSGTGNINVNPLFVDASSGNLRLQSTSPVIDAGNNAAVPSGIVTDLDGNPRFVNIPAVTDTGNGASPIVDMGAYEAQQIGGTFKIFLPLVLKGTP